jgi:hypothetical protein
MKQTKSISTAPLQLAIPEGIDCENVAARRDQMLSVNPGMNALIAEQIALTAEREQSKHAGRKIGETQAAHVDATKDDSDSETGNPS